ncbi:MAG: TAXI family TRAP transporter solute-binding subunit [Sulfolobales archaeon]
MTTPKVALSKTMALVIAVIVIIGIAISFTLIRPTAPTPITPTTPTTPTIPFIRVGTSALGTTGYKIAVFIADVIARAAEVPANVYPYSRAEIGIKDLCKNNNEITYISDTQFLDLYAFRGAFEGFQGEVKKMPVQTLWVYTLEVFFLVKAEDKDKYKSWEDLQGKPVFLTPLGWGAHLHARRLLGVLGINVTHVEMSTDKVVDALRGGTIVAFLGYSASGGVSLPPWIASAELLIDLAPLNPSADEIRKLEDAGYGFIEIDAAKLFSRNKGMGKILASPFFFGWGAAIDLPEELVYKVLVQLEKDAPSLVSVASEFIQVKTDIVGLQVAAVRSLVKSGIPIHPGLAKYLKEKGAWNPEWDKLVATSLIPVKI